jgi:ATP-binding protein involved in chromosome partitioning
MANSQDKPDTALATAALDRLNSIIDPRSGKGLYDAGMVQGLSIRGGRAGFMMEVRGEDVALYGPVHEAAEAALRELPGVDKAQVVLTASEPPPAPGAVRVRKGASLASDPKATPRPPVTAETPAGVKRVIAVASGKGGVGKSTVAVNLALAFQRAGLSVGLLDADVYGPSIPTLLGADGSPEFVDGKLEPLVAHGIRLMSIGFLVDEGAAMIWRGPMASSAFNQMSREVAWASAEAPLDVLVVDMPPGTGDIQLSLVQKITMSGAVVVSTPQEVALIDARRAISMFRKTEVPILGVVENMAFFPDPATGAPIEIFGRSGAKAEAEAAGAPFLGEIPIDIALREAGDMGRPLVATTPESVAARAFAGIAEAVAKSLA